MIKTVRVKSALMALAAILLNAAPSGAQTPVIEYAYPDQSVWTTKVDAAGNPENPLLRLVGAIFSRADIPWSAQSYPAGRMFEALRVGRANFSMLVDSPALRECCLLSKKPVAGTELRVYGAPEAAPIRSREDLAGKNVILIRGYSYAGLRDFVADERNRMSSHMAATHLDAFRMLAHGRADYVLDYVGPANEIMAAQPNEPLVSYVLSRVDVYLVLSKAYPQAEAVMARLEAIADDLPKEAVLKGTAK